jgi:hypothetical protein
MSRERFATGQAAGATHSPVGWPSHSRGRQLGAERLSECAMLEIAVDRRVDRGRRRVPVTDLHLHEQRIESVLDQMRHIAVTQRVRPQLARGGQVRRDRSRTARRCTARSPVPRAR